MAGGTFQVTATTWLTWNCTTNSTTTSCSDNTWTTWSGTTAATNNASNTVTWHCAEISAAEQKRIDQANIKRDEKLKEIAEQRKVAKQKAERLLKRHLTKEQEDQYEDEKTFHVISENGHRYEVDCQKRSENVYKLDKRGRRIMRYCIHARSDIPLPDNALAQKLMLEHNEKEFLRVANSWSVSA